MPPLRNWSCVHESESGHVYEFRPESSEPQLKCRGNPDLVVRVTPIQIIDHACNADPVCQKEIRRARVIQQLDFEQVGVLFVGCQAGISLYA